MKPETPVGMPQTPYDDAMALARRMGRERDRRFEQLMAAEAERDRLRRFVLWVASHRLVEGIYADDDHQYTEWISPEGEEMEFDEVHERAEEALRGA